MNKSININPYSAPEMKLKKAAPFFFMVVFVALCANGLLLVLIHQRATGWWIRRNIVKPGADLCCARNRESNSPAARLHRHRRNALPVYYYDIGDTQGKPAVGIRQPPIGIRWSPDASVISFPQASAFTDRSHEVAGFPEELLGLAKILAATEAMTKIEQVAFATQDCTTR